MINILLNDSYLGVAIFLNLGQLRTTSGQVNFLGYLSDGQVVFKSCSEHCIGHYSVEGNSVTNLYKVGLTVTRHNENVIAASEWIFIYFMKFDNIVNIDH